MGFLNFLTSIVCFFLFLFSFNLFFAKRGSRTLNCLLGVIFFSRFGQILVLLLVHSKQQAYFSFFHQLFTPLYFAAPACFFLYVKHFISDEKRLSVREWLHFIPVVVFTIHVLPLGLGPVIDWDAILKQITNNQQLFITARSGLLPAYFYYIGRPLLVLGYLVAAWCLVMRSEKLKAVKDDDPGKRWILILIRAATFFQLISFIPLISGGLQSAHPNSIYVIIGCLVMLFIMVFVLHRPEIFYRYLFVPADSGLAKVEGIKAQQSEKVTLPANPAKKINLLSAELCSDYARMMQAFMENNKPYLMADFQIVDLATAVDIPVHHCSFIVNNHIGKNFRDWINGYRVSHFMEQYPLKSEKMTIEAIAYESGFKSLGTFYNAFKKETGLMPKAYFSQEKGS